MLWGDNAVVSVPPGALRPSKVLYRSKNAVQDIYLHRRNCLKLQSSSAETLVPYVGSGLGLGWRRA